MKRYMLTEPAFVGLALLAAGSIITDADLPEAPELDGEGNPTGESFRSPPPKSSIEVDEAGQPVNKRDIGKVIAAPAVDESAQAAQAEQDTARAEQADKIAGAAAQAAQLQRRGK